MRRSFGIYLGCTGAAALLAIVFPGSVLIGIFAGLVPGILLALAPNAFLYSLFWWGSRELIIKAGEITWVTSTRDPSRRMLRRIAGVLAAATLASAGFLLPHFINIPAQDTVAMLRADDRDLANPVALPPVVGILMRGNYDQHNKKRYCETLCQRLLYNGAVSRIIIVEERSGLAAGTFWIERRDECPEPAIPRFDIRWPTDPGQRGETPEDRVRARIARGECLLQGADSLEEAGATISFRNIKSAAGIFSHQWTLVLDTVTANRLEIVGAGGRVLYRRTEVTAEPLIRPLLIETRAGLLTSLTYAGWARSKQTYAPMGPNGRDVLPSLLGEAVRLPDKPAL